MEPLVQAQATVVLEVLQVPLEIRALQVLRARILMQPMGLAVAEVAEVLVLSMLVGQVALGVFMALAAEAQVEIQLALLLVARAEAAS